MTMEWINARKILGISQAFTLVFLGLLSINVAFGSTATSHNQIAATSAANTLPQKVKVGFLLLSGSKLDFGTSSSNLDFYVWLKYMGNSKPTFEFVNSKDFKITPIEEKIPYKGTNENYLSYRVRGTFDQELDFKNYPFGQMKLRILMEDPEKPISQRIYVPDDKSSGYDESFHIPGWKIIDFKILSKIHKYKTDFGVPVGTANDSYSRIDITLHIANAFSVILIKNIIPAVFFILISLFGVFLPIEWLSQKLELCFVSIFTSVAWNITLNQGMPYMSYLTFSDKMMFCNYFVVFVNFCFVIVMFIAGKYNLEKRQISFLRASRIVVPLLFITLYTLLISELRFNANFFL